MQITSAYFISGQFLGQSQFECDIAPHSLAMFCATCGEVWGRISCTTPHQPAHWTVDTCPCPKHERSGVPDWSKVPGTITDAFLTQQGLSKMWWGRAIENLPSDVIQREFSLLLNYYSKELQHD